MEEKKWEEIENITDQCISHWQLLPNSESICLFLSFYALLQGFSLMKSLVQIFGLFYYFLWVRLQDLEMYLFLQEKSMKTERIDQTKMRKLIIKLKELNLALPGLLSGIILFGLLSQVIGLFLVQDKANYSVGLWIGVLTANFMALHMAISLNSAVQMDVKGAQATATRHNIIRYLVVVLILGILMITRIGNPLAAFVGMMGLKVSAYLQPFFSKVSSSKGDNSQVS